METFHFNQNTNLTVDRIPDECPFCHNKIKPNIVGNNTFKNGSITEEARIILSCPNKSCNEVFIAYYKPHSLPNSNKIFSFQKTSFGRQLKKQFHESIIETSPNFIEIYNQAYQSEQYDLKEICGVGYRKALEFLIKDFCKKYNPEKVIEIETKPLGYVIENYIDDMKIKHVSKRAVWIANDETHYIRKWEDKDLNDLKMTIDLIATFIESKSDYDKLMESMPEPVKNK